MKKPCRKVSWTPLTDNLDKESTLVDNEFIIGIKTLGLFEKAYSFGLQKKKGYGIQHVMFSILIWPLLTVTSLHFFCGNRLSAYFNGKKDVLYDFLKRQNINWKGYRTHVAKRFYQQHDLAKDPIRAAIFDDSIKRRRGRNVAGVSSHFDHTLGKHVMGHQVLEMGLATTKTYLPLDSQIYIGDTKTQEGKKALNDYRTAVGKDYLAARYSDKNTMLRNMLKRAKKSGFKFTHVMADSWFGNRDNIAAVVSEKITAIFRMKRGNLQYILNGERYTAKELYALIARHMTRLKKSDYRVYILDVHLDLSINKKVTNIIPVRLLFSASVKQKEENWALFLSTDMNLSAEKILELYSLRWSIEVYFKEVKQHFGFLVEETGDYAVHYASVHLCAIRFILVAHSMLVSGNSFGIVRNEITKRMERLTFARLLWELFKALISGAIDSLKNRIPESILELVKEKIVSSISEFLDKALQLDSFYLENEIKAEAKGVY